MEDFLNGLLGFSSPREYQTKANLLVLYGQYYEHKLLYFDNNSLDLNKIAIM